MDAETQELLRGSIRDLIASGEDVVTGLRDLGWDDVVADDPDVAVDLLFSEQGASGRASSALDTVAYATAADGVNYPVIHPFGATGTARVVDNTVHVDGVLMAEPAGPAVIATPDGATYLVDASACATDAHPVSGFSPHSRLRRIQLDIDLAAVASVDIDWAAVATAGRRALATELVGNGNGMLRLATGQIADRHQFGRPIGANQSPRHRLAEAYALLGGAAELISMAGRSGTSWDAVTAKAYAGHASDVTSRACLQVCGAIGLTTEHLLPGYVQRARILDALYGGWTAAVTDIGAELLTAAAVPPGARL